MEEVMKLTPRQFEEFVAEIFEEEGFRVELTQQTRDDDKDIIVASKGLLEKACIMLSAKKGHLVTKLKLGLSSVLME
jgi:HJR/Mrr/RecB family endonuclease